VALAKPGATLITLWDRLDVYKVARKVFASCGVAEGLSFKTTEIAFAVLTETGRGRRAPGFAWGRWVNVPIDGLAREEAVDWIATSHRLVAAELPRKARLELGLGA